MARAKKKGTKQRCPECKKICHGARGLGKHRSAAHGIVGAKRKALMQRNPHAPSLRKINLRDDHKRNKTRSAVAAVVIKAPPASINVAERVQALVQERNSLKKDNERLRTTNLSLAARNSELAKQLQTVHEALP